LAKLDERNEFYLKGVMNTEGIIVAGGIIFSLMLIGVLTFWAFDLLPKGGEK
jgi:hypothetical protein